MAKFTPDQGTLFYTSSMRNFHKESGDTLIAVKDRSYFNVIWRCKGFDDRAVVGEPVFGGATSSPVLLLREEWEFIPVGPAVINALQLKTAQGV